MRIDAESSARLTALEAEARGYQAALDGVAQGVCIFDCGGRLIAANRGFAALHRLSPNALPRFASLRELAEALTAAGTCPMARDDYVAYCEAIQARRESRVWCATLADGRVLRVNHQPTRDGGWVAIHADVSEAREMRRLRETCATLQALIDRVPGHLWVKDCESRFLVANQALAVDLGRASAAGVVGLADFELHPAEETRERRRRELGVILSGETAIARDETFVTSRGERKRTHSTTAPLRDGQGRVAGLVGVSLEGPADREREAAVDEVDILDMVAAGAPATTTLAALSRFVESHSPGVVASILRLDANSGRLRHAARSILPDALRDATENVPIDGESSAFAATLAQRSPVFSLELSVDPQWLGIGGVARSSGLRACWTAPILGRDDQPLGVLAAFARASRTPDAAEARRLRFASRLAAIAMERELSSATRGLASRSP